MMRCEAWKLKLTWCRLQASATLWQYWGVQKAPCGVSSTRTSRWVYPREDALGMTRSSPSGRQLWPNVITESLLGMIPMLFEGGSGKPAPNLPSLTTRQTERGFTLRGRRVAGPRRPRRQGWGVTTGKIGVGCGPGSGIVRVGHPPSSSAVDRKHLPHPVSLPKCRPTATRMDPGTA